MSIYTDIPLDSDRDHIRVLDIFPSRQRGGNLRERVRCYLRCVDLDVRPDFNALSYTWGDEAIRANITVNEEMISVTANLASALSHMRSSDRVVTVWADALCINQADDVEKAHQIRRMSDIYGKASRTIVWLGPRRDGSDLAMQALRSTGIEAEKLGLLDHTALALSVGLETQDPKFQGLRTMIERVGWLYPFKAVHNLCGRPYWSRLWVLQEYALATEIRIQCGDCFMDSEQYNAGFLFLACLQLYLMETIVEGADLSIPMQAGVDCDVDTDGYGQPLGRFDHMVNNATGPGAGRLIEARRLYDSWQQKSDMTAQNRLCILLERTLSRSEASPGMSVRNSKDRIFGLLGLLGKGVELGFAVDYRMSDEELFVDATRWMISSGQVSLLSYAQVQATMPSWSPDWRRRFRDPNMTKGLFKPSGSHSVRATPISDDTIQFRGLRLDTVTWRGGYWQAANYERMDPEFSWEEGGRFLREVEDMMATQQHVPSMLPEMSREQWAEGTWRIPIADQYTNGTGAKMRAIPAAKAGWEAVKLGTAGEKHQGYRTSDVNFYAIALSRLHGRRLALTSQGLLGLMPADVEVGDIVAIIVGAESPMLLRPSSEGGAYKIVGECYVYGIMDGEMIGTDTVFTHIDVC